MKQKNTSNGNSNRFVTIREFYESMNSIERRLSRLEIIYYIQIILWLATLLKLLVG